MITRKTLCRVAIWLSAFAVLAACAAGAPKPVEVAAAVAAAETLNPDASGRPSPVVVRIYQLRSDGNFKNADFFSLYDQDQATLGAELISREELQVLPGEGQKYDTEISPDCRYIGVMAAFRDYENAQWRDLAEVPEQKKLLGLLKDDSLQIQLDSLAVSVSLGE